MNFKKDLNSLANDIFSKDYVIAERKVEQKIKSNIIQESENIDLDLDLLEDFDLDIEEIQPEEKVEQLFDGYLGEKNFAPNPLEYGPNAMYRQNGVVYRKSVDNLWEAYLKDGAQGPKGSAGGSGVGVQEVQKIINQINENFIVDSYDNLSASPNNKLIFVKDLNSLGDYGICVKNNINNIEILAGNGFYPFYKGFWKCNQTVSSGPPTDYTKNNNDLKFTIGWIDNSVGPWKTNGWVNTSSGVGTSAMKCVYISPESLSAINLTQKSILLSFQISGAPVSANQAYVGNSNTGNGTGFYLSNRATTGKIRPVVITSTNTYNNLTDSNLSFYDGSIHTLTIAFDSVNRSIYLWRDDILSDYYPNVFTSGDIPLSPNNFYFGGTVTNASYEYLFKNIQLMVWDGGLPYNLNHIVNSIYNNQNLPLKAVI